MSLLAPFGTAAPGLPVVRALIETVKSLPLISRGQARGRLAQFILNRHGGRLDLRFRGASFRIHGHNPVEYGMLLRRRYNRKEIDFLLGGLQGGGTAVDVGSNTGMYTVLLAKEADRVISIDASEAFMKHARINADFNDLTNIAFVHVAVGGSSGRARIQSVRGNPGTAIVESDANGDTPMRPLLEVLEERGVQDIDVFKADIDGSEEQALGPFFRNCPDAMLPRRVVVEHLWIDPEGANFVATMAARGYRKVGRTRSNALYVRA